MKTLFEIILLALLVGTILYATLFLMVIIYYSIKYPNSSNKDIFGNYIGMKKEYKAIENKMYSICMEKLPFFSYMLGFVYSMITLLNT